MLFALRVRAAMTAGPSIFVVVEGAGEYSDRCETLLAWYPTREQADARVASLLAKAMEKYGTRWPGQPSDLSDENVVYENGGPDYSVQEVAAGFAETHLAPPEGGR